MPITKALPLLNVCFALMLSTPVLADQKQMVLGSFHDVGKARAWAQQVTQALALPATVEPYAHGGKLWHRVTTGALTPVEQQRGALRARNLGWDFWLLPAESVAVVKNKPARHAGNTPVAQVEPTTQPINARARSIESTKQVSTPTTLAQPVPAQAATQTIDDDLMSARATTARQEFDVDLALQSRSYLHEGLVGQSQWHLSSSASFRWRRSWADEQRSITLTPFLRWDAQDDDRTHVDLRDFYGSLIGDDWELHVGLKRVFWGVTEFHHLVDVINQTDLVENIDGEDKLGQPMVQLSLVRDWGILDMFVLPGFRERTFPGDDGRLRALLPIDNNGATYASSAEQYRTDGAIRYSHQLAGVDFGIYHFSGTNREPQLRVVGDGVGGFELQPHYRTIDQTGLDAQANWGDWALKLEAITRSGDGDRYTAANLGVERTLVGIFGSRIDLGLVAEYLFDERGDDAINIFFEQDLALGWRWQFNDIADTQALVGVIWDSKSDELVTSIEASRRFGDYWQMRLEARFFAGTDDPRDDVRDEALLRLLADPRQKTASLQRDDFLQLEFTRYF